VRADGQRRRYRLRTEPLREIDEWLAPYRAIPEFSPSGKLLFNAGLPAGILTHRACRLPWTPGV
jgi:hypothetical protein